MSFLSKTSALASGLFLCTALFAGTPPEEINIAYVKAPFNLSTIVLKDKMLLEQAFQKEGTKINWIPISSGSTLKQGFASKSLDYSPVLNTSTFLILASAGYPLSIAAGSAHPAETFGIVGRPKSSGTLKDLKGKKIAGPRGTVLHQFLLDALEKEGMKEKDVQLVSMSPQQALPALFAGAVDGALVGGNTLMKGVENGAPMLMTAKGVTNVNLISAVRNEFWEKHPEAVKKIVEAQKEALKYIEENRAEAVELGAKETGITAQQAEKLLPQYGFYTRLTPDDVKGMEKDQKFLVKNGLMPKSIDIESHILPTAKE